MSDPAIFLIKRLQWRQGTMSPSVAGAANPLKKPHLRASKNHVPNATDSLRFAGVCALRP